MRRPPRSPAPGTMRVRIYSKGCRLRPDEQAVIVRLENAGHAVEELNGRFFAAQPHQVEKPLPDLVVTDRESIRHVYARLGVAVVGWDLEGAPVTGGAPAATPDAPADDAASAASSQAAAESDPQITHEIKRNGRWTIWRGGAVLEKGVGREAYRDHLLALGVAPDGDVL